LDDRSLLIARTECYVRRFGTVQGIFVPQKIAPRHSAEERFLFMFSRALNKPHGCTMILFDQFGKKHKKWIRLHYGKPHDPF
jgi:hypothetical protein